MTRDIDKKSLSLPEEHHHPDLRTDYELPSYNKECLQPLFQNGKHTWNFVFGERFFSAADLIFVSDEDYYKYRTVENQKGNDHNCAVEKYQQSNNPIPVLSICNRQTFIGSYLTAYRCTRPENGRRFNKSVDRLVFCKIKHSSTWQFKRHTLSFTPDPMDKSKNFEVVMVTQKRQGISDFMLKGEKYRWLRNFDHKLGKHSWAYILQKLSDTTFSMVDKFDHKNKPITKEFKDSFYTSLLPNQWIANSKFLSDNIIGEVFDSREFSFVWNSISTKFSYDTTKPNSDMGESEYEIPLDALVFLCMSAIFKKIERGREERDQAFRMMR